jgi:alpha-methylacyl-CoA racemase
MNLHGSGPLQGVRVLELGGIGPGPFCAMLLSDLGAEVIRVVRLAEVGQEPNPVLHRGRRTLAVDLKDAAGTEVVRRICRRADVLVEGFRPGVAERLGLGPDDLRPDNPRLVYGRMTGFGQDGPLAQRAGHDLNYVALSGALAAIGRPGQPPVAPLNLVGDFGGGGLMLALGVVSALLHARQTGQGQVVDAAMVEGAGLLMSMTYGLWGAGRWDITPASNVYDGGAPFYDSYLCADGRYVAIAAVEPEFYATLLKGLGLHDRVDATEQRDKSTWECTRKLIADVFAERSRDEWVAAFDGLDACLTPVLTMQEVLDHPHLAARGSFYRDGSGVVHPHPAPRFSETHLDRPEPACAAGEHAAAVLTDLGYSGEQVDRLVVAGVVA